MSVRAGSPRGRTKSPRGGKRKGGGGHHHHHQNTPQVDELLGLVRKNRLEDCVRVLSNYPEDVRRETFGSKYLRKTFLDYAKKVGASREAFSFLIEADKVDANCHTSSSLAGSKAESASNLIYYDTRMAGRVIGVCARNGDSRLARKTMDYLSQDKGLQLDIFMYTSAINACARRGEVQVSTFPDERRTTRTPTTSASSDSFYSSSLLRLSESVQALQAERDRGRPDP